MQLYTQYGVSISEPVKNDVFIIVPPYLYVTKDRPSS